MASLVTFQQSRTLTGVKTAQNHRNAWWIAFGLTAENQRGNLKEQLSPTDKMVQIPVLDIRTASQTLPTGGIGNRIPSSELIPTMIQAPTRQIVTSQEYNSDEIAAWNSTFPSLNFLGALQGAARTAINLGIARLAILGSGFSAYEGLFNASGKKTVSALLATDSGSKTKFPEQNAGELRDAMFSEIVDVLQDLNLIDNLEETVTVAILSTQRLNAQLSSKVIRWTDSGNGMGFSIKQALEEQFAKMNVKLVFGSADAFFKDRNSSLAATTGYDQMLITVPTMPNANAGLELDTNYLADSGEINKFLDNNLMAASNFVPTEMPTIIENGYRRIIYRIPAITSGWNIQADTVKTLTVRFA